VVTVPDGILPPGSKVTVAVDGLRLRDDPSVTAGVQETLAKGQALTITHSVTFPLPVVVDGVTWYSARTNTSPPAIGWVAAGDVAGTSYLTLSEPSTCADVQPDTVTLTQLIQVGSWHRLACLGNAQITVSGVIDFHCQGGTVSPRAIFRPGWLVDWCPQQTLTPQETILQQPHDTLDMVTPPGGPAVQSRGTIVRVTGHFGDPASATGEIRPDAYQDSWGLWEGAERLVCQEQFVVTNIEKIGVMEDLPPE
jgi:hypothetical protein